MSRKAAKGPLLSWVTNGFAILEPAPATAAAMSFLWPSASSPLNVWVIEDAEFIASCKITKSSEIYDLFLLIYNLLFFYYLKKLTLKAIAKGECVESNFCWAADKCFTSPFCSVASICSNTALICISNAGMIDASILDCSASWNTVHKYISPVRSLIYYLLHKF